MRFDSVGIFLWSYSKTRFYAYKLFTPEHLKTPSGCISDMKIKKLLVIKSSAVQRRLGQVMAETPFNRCRKIVEIWFEVCKDSRGTHLSHVVFNKASQRSNLLLKKESYNQEMDNP